MPIVVRAKERGGKIDMQKARLPHREFRCREAEKKGGWGIPPGFADGDQSKGVGRESNLYDADFKGVAKTYFPKYWMVLKRKELGGRRWWVKFAGGLECVGCRERAKGEPGGSIEPHGFFLCGTAF